MHLPRRRLLAAAVTTAALAVASPAVTHLPSASALDAGSTPGAAGTGTRAAAGSLELTVPRRQIVYGYGSRIYSDLGIRLIAHGAPLEIRAHRVSYDEPLVVTATLGGEEVTLPDGAMRTFSGLSDFLRLDIQRLDSHNEPVGDSTRVSRSGCLGAVTDRATPDAVATSPYPHSCYYNPYSLGAVLGIQAGWAASIADPYTALRMAGGRYDITVSLRPRVARALGVPAGATAAPTRVIVREYPTTGPGHGPDRAGQETDPQVDLTTPNAHRPTGERVPPTQDGPVPDLRSLPAWGIQVSPSGKYLQFSATVWNAGSSPLVVDGFRRTGEDLMDGYQYFFDADGNQTGYQPVGTFEWDPKPTHQHWHFQDFATYTLLRADQSAVVRSRKEAFCLANTDAVDLTVPDARWDISSDDLSTACGDYGSRSIREALVAGWGDTYAQFRAGQSFKIDGLPNGVYYIEVAANPTGNLVESDETNNVALRKISLGGTPTERTVTVEQVGLVVEPSFGGMR